MIRFSFLKQILLPLWPSVHFWHLIVLSQGQKDHFTPGKKIKYKV
jgi:hypothetical protein